MKTTKNIMKVKQKDLFDFKKNSSQNIMQDPTTKMMTVTKSNTQSITTIFM